MLPLNKEFISEKDTNTGLQTSGSIVVKEESNGNVITVFNVKGTNMVSVGMSKDPLPKDLDGMFTEPMAAMRRIERYLELKEHNKPKETKPTKIKE